MTREEWLNELTARMRPWFKDAGHEIPEKVRVTCGWPATKPLARKKRAIGECWNPECSQDKTTEIFISPFLSDPIIVGATLVHELIHAAVGLAARHKGPFVTAAKKLGLQSPWTATTPSDALVARIKDTLPGIIRTPVCPCNMEPMQHAA